MAKYALKMAGIFLYSILTYDLVAGAEISLKDKQLFQKKIDNDGQIVVMQTDIDKNQLKPFLTKEALASNGRAYNIRVEMQTATTLPVLLTTKLCFETDTEHTGFDVVDVAFDSQNVVVAATLGYELYLWQIPIGNVLRSSSWTPITGWQVLALRTPIDRQAVQAKLRQTDDHSWILEVVDLRAAKQGKPSEFPPTLFRQVEHKWQFEAVKRAEGH